MPGIQTQRRLKAIVSQTFRKMTRQAPEIRILQLDYRNGNNLQVFFSKRPGNQVGVIVDFFSGLEHPVLKIRPNGGIIPERLTHRVDRHTCFFRYSS